MSHSDNSIIEPKMSASFVPDHKAPMVLFLDRVYGIDNQDFLLHVLEVGFLPDMRAAASLDTVSLKLFTHMQSYCIWSWRRSAEQDYERAVGLNSQVAFSTTEMALALNRYLCSAVLPLITKCAPLFAGSDHRAIMIDSMLHTIYRLSRGRAFTKAQRDIIEECLMALCKWVGLVENFTYYSISQASFDIVYLTFRHLRPSMLQHLLRRLVFDVPILNEYAKMPLKVWGP